MASAEARARWLRYANHCIVQEDYKGPSRPSSLPPSSSKSRSEEGTGDGAKSYDFPGDTRWWLHQQPKDNATSFWEQSWETLEIKEFAKIKELEADTSQQKPMDGEVWSQDDHPEKLFSEMESQFIRINKTEPWWRTADLNDLSSFVSDKSLDNSDLPRPQIYKPSQWFVPDKGLASLDQISNFTDSLPKSPTSIGIGQSQCGLDIPLSTTFSEAEDMQGSSELSKAQLLEALCHSQTRAREAEEAAQKAQNEKEHVITHFLRQASQLFAYKQWLHILQLETTCRNSKNQPIYTRFPDFVPIRAKQQKRVRPKPAKTKSGSPRYEIGWRILLGLTLVGAGLLLGWSLGWLFK